jgi:predicted nucleic acid-binding protein
LIVVDSSVWIDFLNGRKASHVERLRGILGTEEVIVGDLMLCEVLQGLNNERAAREVEALLRRFEIAPMPATSLQLRRPAISGPCASAASLSARPSTC